MEPTDVKSNYRLLKAKMGDSPIVYISGDVFPFKDTIKKHGAKWNSREKFWFWFLDKNDPQRTIDTFVKPALEEAKKIKELPIEIDKIIAAMVEESPSQNPSLSITKKDEDDIKRKLEKFKEMLINIEDDEEFKDVMKKVIDIKAAQGYKFSLGNSFLIMIQDRAAGMVNSKTNWLSKYNRMLKPKARPLMIWAPQGIKNKLSKDKQHVVKGEYFKKIKKRPNDKLTPNEKFGLEKELRGYTYATRFKLVPVYSVNDTYQIEGTEDYIKASEESKKDIKWFEDNMISDEVRPIYTALVSFAEDSGIKIDIVDDLGGARGSSAGGAIKLLKNEGNDVGLTKTLIHEIAHELLHQTYLKNKGGESGKYHIGKDMGTQTIEQQAEISSWMVMYAFGFDVKTTSLNYTVMWGGDKDNMVQVFNTVSKIVNHIIDSVNKKIASLTEGTHTHGDNVSPLDIAKMLGFESEYEALTEIEGLGERLLRRVISL